MNALSERLAARLGEAFRAPFGLTGTASLRVTDDPSANLAVTVGDRGISFSDADVADADVVVEMSARGLAAVLDSPTLVDFRFIPWSQLAAATGDVRLAILVGRLLKRPEPGIEERFSALEALARAHPTRAVPRLDRPGAEDVVAALRVGQPLVLTGLLGDWAAVGTGPADLAERFGHLKLAGQPRDTTFGDFLHALSDPVGARTASSAGCSLPGAMWASFPFPLFDAAAFTPRQLWAGARRTDRPITRLHRDPQHAFLGHLFGRKRFRLYPPDQSEALYASAGYNFYQPCRAEPDYSDPSVFPLISRAAGIELTLAPGDLLVTPAGWFHTVFADDPVFSVSGFMRWDAWTALR